MSIATWMGSRVSGAAPAIPVNTGAPVITGDAIEGATNTFDVGTWTNDPTTFEIEIRVSGGARDGTVLVARTTVTAISTGTFDAFAGESVIMQVWATNGAGTGTATSAAFGPLAAAATLIIGLAVNTDQPGSLPAGWGNTGSPLPLYDGVNNLNGVLWGSEVASTMATRTDGTDARLRGRHGVNLGGTDLFIIEELGAGGLPPGNYQVFIGAGSSITTSPNFALWDGDPDAGGTLRLDRTPIPVTGGQVLHADGTVSDQATWVAASPEGGNPVTIAINSGRLTIRRATGGGATQLNSIAVKTAP